MAGLHRHVLNFDILDTGNPKTLVFLDESEYMEQPERPLLEVVMPGFDKYFLVNIEASKVNTFNSNTLNLTAVLKQDFLTNLPDGIWDFRYKICPYDKVFTCKKHMRTALLNEKLALLHSKIDLSDCDTKDDKDLEKDLFRIYSLIEGAKAVVNINAKKAQSYYQIADKMIQKLLDKFCKNCK